MSRTINQLPVATSLTSTDKLYKGESPFGTTNDRAVTWGTMISTVNSTAQLASSSQVTGFNTAAAAAAPVQTVNSLTGVVTLTTSNINEGTNLYFTNTRADARISNAVATNTVQGYSSQLAALANLSNLTTGPVIQYPAGTFINPPESSFSGTSFGNLTNNVKWGSVVGFTSASTITVSLDGTGIDSGYYFDIVCQTGALINFTGINGSSIFGLTQVRTGTTSSNISVIRCWQKHIGEWYVSQISPFKLLRTVSITSDTPTAADINNIIYCTNTGTTNVTLPNDTNNPNIPVGAVFNAIAASSSGTVNLLPDTGVTITNTSIRKTSSPYQLLTVIKVASNTYTVLANGGSIAVQSASNVTITGGFVTGTFVNVNPIPGTTYTLATTDSNTILTFSSNSAVTVTVPDLGAGFFCKCIQFGTGQITFVGSSNTLDSANAALKTRAQYSPANISQVGIGVAIVDGDLTQ